jgi:dihydrodipicolinate synthase/N-acetylneuraminate lyase
MSSMKIQRMNIVKQLFPDGIPELWCPLLTHYDSGGTIDKARMKAHLRQLSPWVKNYLVPGSTGDGWEMDVEEVYKTLDVVLDIAASGDIQILVGILKTEKGEARQAIQGFLEWLGARTGKDQPMACLKAARVCGFTVCPPKGEELSQSEIEAELSAILDIGVPTAIYQLPQITKNEVSPEVLSRLAQKYANFYLFKDTSGNDRVALAGFDYDGVFLVRGAEGGYVTWLKQNGGVYDGFLLSTANCFAQDFHLVIEMIKNGRLQEADELSQRLSDAIGEVFKAVASLPAGNAFTNANKAMDHALAYGAEAVNLEGPRLHSGGSIPGQIIRETVDVLKHYGFFNENGYLGPAR